VLAKLPRAGLPIAVLCGSRDLELASRLREACSPFGRDARVIVASQPLSEGYAPSAIWIEVTDAGILDRLAECSGVTFAAEPPAWRLLRYSASVKDYEAKLAWTSEPDPEWYRKDFSPGSLTFSWTHAEGQTRLSSFKDPVTQRQIYRIWCNGRAAMVDRDWGRWLYLKEAGIGALFFDSNAQRVAVPATAPLPGLLGRALTLSSGLVPHRLTHPTEPMLLIDVYSAVSREAAEFLAEKLSQVLIPSNFS